MGVEYVHHLVAEDPFVEFSEEQIGCIVEIFESHGIWQPEAATVYIGNDGKESRQKTSDGWIRSVGARGEVVETLFGKSRYGAGAEDRYLAGIDIVFGSANKIHSTCGEELEVSVQGVDLVEIDLHVSQPFYEMTFDFLGEDNIDIYTSSLDLADYPWFKGWWRCAVVLDFHKDLPVWSVLGENPCRNLINELSSATGIPFREIGGHN